MIEDTVQFDFNQVLQDIKVDKSIAHKSAVLTPLIKHFIDATLKAEQERNHNRDDSANRKNGCTSNTFKTAACSFELDTPSDRTQNLSGSLLIKIRQV